MINADSVLHRRIARAIWNFHECPWDFDNPPEGMAQLQKELALAEAQCVLAAFTDQEPDWWYCDLDPDDSGDTPHEALRNTENFKIELLHSSFIGPDKFAFRAPTLDPTNDDEEVLLFDTAAEAEAAVKERQEALAPLPSPENTKP